MKNINRLIMVINNQNVLKLNCETSILLRKSDVFFHHFREMPKMTEKEPPNFAASNKFAFLQTEDNSD